VTCPDCGASAPDGARFCPSCGRRLTDTSRPPTSLAPDETTLELDATTLAAELTALAQDATTLAGPAARPRQVNLAPGSVLADRYRIERMLGRGGMGEVYKAQDLRLGQTVALKFLPPELARDPERLELFHSEVRIARTVTHPNVTRVYDIVEGDGHLFLSMEFVDGEDLAMTLKKHGRFEARAGVELMRQICAGLAAIHGADVLHRDLKPANIMIDRAGRIHLMDFGLASGIRVHAGSGGTPGYMAPEQLLEQTSSIKSDIYALGLVLHEIFTGERGHVANTVDELVSAHRTGTAMPAIETSLGSVEPSVAAAIRACLERDPERRPASARDVAAMVRVVLLEGKSRGRRIAQQLLPAAGGFLAAVGLSAAGVAPSEYRLLFLMVSLTGAVVVAATFRLTLDWRVNYKGHEIHFQNHPFRGERLYIDGRKVATGGVGLRKTLQGTLERGDGAGERITAESLADPREFRVTILAEQFK